MGCVHVERLNARQDAARLGPVGTEGNEVALRLLERADIREGRAQVAPPEIALDR